MRWLARFLSDIAGTPMANRRSGLSNRKASVWRRALALGFLAGIATSVALWSYDKSAQRQVAG